MNYCSDKNRFNWWICRGSIFSLVRFFIFSNNLNCFKPVLIFFWTSLIFVYQFSFLIFFFFFFFFRLFFFLFFFLCRPRLLEKNGNFLSFIFHPLPDPLVSIYLLLMTVPYQQLYPPLFLLSYFTLFCHTSFLFLSVIWIFSEFRYTPRIELLTLGSALKYFLTKINHNRYF